MEQNNETDAFGKTRKFNAEGTSHTAEPLRNNKSENTVNNSSQQRNAQSSASRVISQSGNISPIKTVKRAETRVGAVNQSSSVTASEVRHTPTQMKNQNGGVNSQSVRNQPIAQGQQARQQSQQSQVRGPVRHSTAQAIETAKAVSHSGMTDGVRHETQNVRNNPVSSSAVQNSGSVQTREHSGPTLMQKAQISAAREKRRQEAEEEARAQEALKKQDKAAEREAARMERKRLAEVRKAERKAAKEAEKKETDNSEDRGNTVVSITKAVVYMIFIIIVSVFLSITVINVANDIYAFVKSDEDVQITIPEYATLDEVATILYENNVIKYPEVFKLYAVTEQYSQDFLAGDYTVNGMMNYDTLLTEFREKPATGTVSITIPEGYTIDEIINLFVANGIGTREGFEDVINNYEFDYWFVRELEEAGENPDRIYRLEGYLFPDTYEFYVSSSEETVINRMLKRFAQIFTKEYRKQCEDLGYTVDEMITLASMIEKEGGSTSEFHLISSVFHNRLNDPWSFARLESDATIVYVLQHENEGVRPSLEASDLLLDNPYNTYMYAGLPPGPIANPSASAILAALSPSASQYYYFIANGGKTYFSETKAEHDAYIQQFRSETWVQTTGDIPLMGDVTTQTEEAVSADGTESGVTTGDETVQNTGGDTSSTWTDGSTWTDTSNTWTDSSNTWSDTGNTWTDTSDSWSEDTNNTWTDTSDSWSEDTNNTWTDSSDSWSEDTNNTWTDTSDSWSEDTSNTWTDTSDSWSDDTSSTWTDTSDTLTDSGTGDTSTDNGSTWTDDTWSDDTQSDSSWSDDTWSDDSWYDDSWADDSSFNWQ